MEIEIRFQNLCLVKRIVTRSPPKAHDGCLREMIRRYGDAKSSATDPTIPRGIHEAIRLQIVLKEILS